MLSKILSAIALFWLSLFNPKQVVTPKSSLVYEEIVPIVVEPTKKVSTQLPTPTIKIEKRVVVVPTKIADTAPWGIAQQIDEHTWTMRIKHDEKMGTAQETFEALNRYRQVHGSRVLEWNDKLSEYANSRAKFFTSINSVDKHKGFADKLKDEGGFKDLGFWGLGENASYGYKLEGVHLIEWMYASDKDHNDNQLDNTWTHVGVGIDGVATAIIFGKHKI